MKTLFIVGFWMLLLPLSFGQSPVKHEVGIDLGVGMSNVLYPDRAQFSPEQAKVVEWSPELSLSTAFKYNALFFDARFNLGIGLGYQRKGYIEARDLDIPGLDLNYIRNSILSESIMLPVEVGYRLPIGGRHSLMADALFIPCYQLSAIPSHHNANPSSSIIIPVINRFNFDIGLKLGYHLQLTEKCSLHASVLGTWEPFQTFMVPQELYNLQFNLGFRFQL